MASDAMFPTNTSIQPPRTPCHESTIATPRTGVPAPQRNHDTTNPYSRRLHLRNAGFKAALIPPRRIIPISGSSVSTSESLFDIFPIYDENQPPAIETETKRHDTLYPTRILQEISNSARRRQQTTRPALESVIRSYSNGSDFLLDSRTNDSPRSSILDMPRSSKLQESSAGEKIPRLNGPFASQARVRRKARINPRSTSFEANQYIEHLESELVSLNTKIDTLTSPLTTTSQAAKIRSLNRQISSFQQELADWETKFEDRVNDEVFLRTQFEADLHTQIKALEAEKEAQDATNQNLERELGMLRTKLVDTESLEATLGRRVDVLTELLAQSPTRLTFPSTPMPSTLDAPYHTASSRPRLPMMTSSPCISRRFSELSCKSLSRDRDSSVSISDVLEFSEHVEQDDLLAEFPTFANHNSSRSTSIQSNSERTDSHRSVGSASSRPTSIISSSSFGTSWGTPLAPEDVKSSCRLRKMRRFGPGSTNLKPLILPTAASLSQSLPASAPVRPSFQSPFRETSSSSLDPAIAFLSQNLDSSSSCTPTPLHIAPSHRRQASWNQSQARDILEGKPCWISDTGATLNDQIKLEESDGCLPSSAEAVGRKSLQAELDLLEVDRISEKSPSPVNDLQDGRAAFDSQSLGIVSPERDLSTTLMGLPSISSRSYEENWHRGHFLNQARATQKTAHYKRLRTKPPSKRNMMPPIKMPSGSVGILHQINGFVASLRDRPMNLARRILANTWSKGSSKVGGLSWWLLGLLFGPKDWKKARVADEEAATNGDSCGSSNAARGPRQRASAPTTCPACVEPPSKRSLKLWCRFSLAIVLAIGVAAIEGPGALLKDDGGSYEQVFGSGGRGYEDLASMSSSCAVSSGMTEEAMSSLGGSDSVHGDDGWVPESPVEEDTVSEVACTGDCRNINGTHS